MGKFVIQPHFRLQEWVAEEKGYFKDEGLDYDIPGGGAQDRRQDPRPGREGRRLPVVREGPHLRHQLRLPLDRRRRRLDRPRQALSATSTRFRPAGIFVPADSPVKKPEDLAGVPISVGYQSGSHYATIQALEQFMPADKINLSFNDGMLFKRLELLVDGKCRPRRCSAGRIISPSSSASARSSTPPS